LFPLLVLAGIGIGIGLAPARQRIGSRAGPAAFAAARIDLFISCHVDPPDA
jgi:hypothetical protein